MMVHRPIYTSRVLILFTAASPPVTSFAATGQMSSKCCDQRVPKHRLVCNLTVELKLINGNMVW
jgi:hypothetical protein